MNLGRTLVVWFILIAVEFIRGAFLGSFDLQEGLLNPFQRFYRQIVLHDAGVQS